MTSREAEKRAGKIVSYSGKERCDLVYALGTLTHATHKSVLYIDNSIFHDLYAVFAGNNDTDEVLDFGDVVDSRTDIGASEYLGSVPETNKNK